MPALRPSLALVFALALCASCAFTSQKVVLAPKLALGASSIGQGTVVAVRVVDERPSQSLGRRGGGFGEGAEITTDQDVAAVVQTEVENGLRTHGFAVNGPGAANAKLDIEIRLLEYSTSVGFWTGGVQVEAALKAIATRGEQRYEKLFRSSAENRVVLVPAADTNEGWINAGLADVLTQLLSDTALLDALRK